MKNKHIGSSLDDFLKEEGIFEEVTAKAIKTVFALQLHDTLKKRKTSKKARAVSFNAVRIKTKNMKFSREAANER